MKINVNKQVRDLTVSELGQLVTALSSVWDQVAADRRDVTVDQFLAMGGRSMAARHLRRKVTN